MGMQLDGRCLGHGPDFQGIDPSGWEAGLHSHVCALRER